MDTQKAKELLQKYKSGSCTPQERALVERWYFTEVTKQPMPKDPDNIDSEEQLIWNKIEADLPQVVTAVRIPLWRKIIVAATILLFLSVGGYFVYYRTASAPLNQIVLNKAESSPQLNKFIQLPDGSIVILGKASKLSYPSSFAGKRIREVYLTGHAFFDVKHNPSQPFIVHSGKVKTTVLGTAFDIISNPGSDQIVVRVIRGKVNVSTESGTIGDLLPDKKVTYYVKSAHSSFAAVNAKHVMEWTKQDMLLNDVTFEAVCVQLEKRYKIRIDIKGDKLKQQKCTISFTADENLDSFLKTICDFNNATYQVNEEGNWFTIKAVN